MENYEELKVSIWQAIMYREIKCWSCDYVLKSHRVSGGPVSTWKGNFGHSYYALVDNIGYKMNLYTTEIGN